MFALSIRLALFALTFSLPVWAQTPLSVVTATQSTTARQFLLDGTVEAVNKTTVSAQTNGQISEILADINDFVNKGDIIIRLKNTEQTAELRKAEAGKSEALANLNQSKKEYTRTKEVFAKKLVAKAKMDSAESALNAAKARYRSAIAQYTQAKQQLEYTVIRAPYSGIVTSRNAEVGEIAQPGTPLMTGLSMENLRVNVDIPQSLINRVRHFKQASVKQPDNGFIPVKKMTIFPFANEKAGTFKVRLQLPANAPGFFPGMYVKIAFVTGERKQLVIPQSAVVHRSEVTAVYVVNDDKISLRQIRTGRQQADGTIVVLSGLSENETVATDPISAGAALIAAKSEQKDD